MQVTEIKVFPVDEEKLKAFVSIVFDHCFMVNDIKIINGRDGLFISMPSRRKKNGKFKDVAHPLNNETRQMIEGLVLGEYESIVDGDAPERRRPKKERPAASEAEKPAPKEPAASGTEKPAAPEMAASGGKAPGEKASEERPPEPQADGEESEESEEEKTLEEVAELHLRDSFWGT